MKARTTIARIVRLATLLVFVAIPGRCALAESSGYFPDWSAIGVPPYPLHDAGINHALITADDVTDYNCVMVADPFLMHAEGSWFLFFEALGYKGVIAVARSEDGVIWHYDRVVFEDTYHISYPFVFRWNDEYYMTVEAGWSRKVRLYKATDFPYGWVEVSTLAVGRRFADPTIFRRNGAWWMFAAEPTNDDCYLYRSDSLESGWVEHPQSPIILNSLSKARPAGRCLLAGGNAYRLAQKCDVCYGEKVRVFQIDVLTATTYAEHEIAQSPILGPGPDGWNERGMHHCDSWWTGSHWIAAVDGLGPDGWSIGIRFGPGGAGEVGSGPGGAGEVGSASGVRGGLRVVPNPVRAGDPWRIVLTGEGDGPALVGEGARSDGHGWTNDGASPDESGRREARAYVEVCDVLGRRVLREEWSGERTQEWWVGESLSGARRTPPPAGAYFVRLVSSSGRTLGRGRVVVTR